MSVVVVSGGGRVPQTGEGTNRGGVLGAIGKRNDILIVLATLAASVGVGYLGSMILAKKLGLGPTAPPPTAAAPLPPMPPTQVPNYAPPVPAPGTYQQGANLNLTGQDLNALFNTPQGPMPIGFGDRVDYSTQSGFGAGFGVPQSFRAKKMHDTDHGHELHHPGPHGFDFDEIGDEYGMDYEDYELAVEDPFLYQMFSVNEHNADPASLDQLVPNQEDDSISVEEEQVLEKMQESDHAHEKDHKGEEKMGVPHSYKYHAHIAPTVMPQEYVGRGLVLRDHKGRLLGLR
jgi:hypothetical protein